MRLNILYQMINRYLGLFFILIFLNSCSTNPTTVSGEDAQKILATQFGTVVDVQAVTIRGKKNQSAAAAGAIIGGLAGNLVEDGKYREILIATGAILGGVVGYYEPVAIGEHNGFQYVVDINDSDEDISIVQSGDDQIPIGSKVTVSIGTNTRIIISE